VAAGEPWVPASTTWLMMHVSVSDAQLCCPDWSAPLLAIAFLVVTVAETPELRVLWCNRVYQQSVSPAKAETFSVREVSGRKSFSQFDCGAIGTLRFSICKRTSHPKRILLNPVAWQRLSQLTP